MRLFAHTSNAAVPAERGRRKTWELVALALLCTVVLAIALISTNLMFAVRGHIERQRVDLMSVPAMIDEQSALIRVGEEAYEDDYRLVALQSALLLNKQWKKNDCNDEVFLDGSSLDGICDALLLEAIAIYDAEGKLYACSRPITRYDARFDDMIDALLKRVELGEDVASAEYGGENALFEYFAHRLDNGMTEVIEIEPEEKQAFRKIVLQSDNIVDLIEARLQSDVFIVWEDETVDTWLRSEWDDAEDTKRTAEQRALARQVFADRDGKGQFSWRDVSRSDAARIEWTLAELKGVKQLVLRADYAGKDYEVVVIKRLTELIPSYPSLLNEALLVFSMMVGWICFLRGRPSVAVGPGESRRDVIRRVRKNTRPRICLVIILALMIAFTLESLGRVDFYAQQTKEEAAWIKQLLEAGLRREKVLVDENVKRFGVRMRTAVLLLGDPEHVTTQELDELCEAVDARFAIIFNMNGEEVLSNGGFVNLSMTDTDENMPFEALKDTMYGKTLAWTDPVMDPLDYRNGYSQYFATQLYDESDPSGLPKGIIALCFDPQRRMQIQEMVSEDTLMNSSGQPALSIDPETGAVINTTIPSLAGKNVGDIDMTGLKLRDGYDGFVLFKGSVCYVSVFAMDGHLIVVINDESMLPDILKNSAIAALLMLLVLLGIFYPLALRWELSGAGAPGDARASDSDSGLGLIISALMVGISIVSFAVFIVGEFRPQMLIGRIVHRQWTKGVNLFALTYAIMISCIGFSLLALMRFALTKLQKYLEARGETLCRLISSLLTYIGAIGLIFYDLSVFGVETSTLLTSAGILSLIIGMGANSLISDILAGLFMIFEGNMRVGDIIEVNNRTGVVEHIGVRTTRLLMDSQDIQVVNNSKIGVLTNKSRNLSTVTLEVPVTAGSLAEADEKAKLVLPWLEEQCTGMIGKPRIQGLISVKDGIFTFRAAFQCREKDREALTMKSRQALYLAAHSVDDE